MSTTIPVIEIFGPTIQGEGMVVGRKTMFVRTAGCDYQCKWCDSSFTWDGSAKDQIKQMTAEEVYHRLIEVGGHCFDHVTISGGNPALLSAVDSVVDLLKKNNKKVALETQGSQWQEWFMKIDDLTISPKPPSSEMETDFETLDIILSRLQQAKRTKNHVSIKVVVFNDEDFEYAVKVHKRYQNIPFYLQVGNEDHLLKDDTQLKEKLLIRYEWLIEKTMHSCEMKDVRVLPQLHTLVWGNKRGV